MKLEWTENPDGTRSATNGEDKIVIYKEDDFWGYYFNDDKDNGDYGFVDLQEAIKGAEEELE